MCTHIYTHIYTCTNSCSFLLYTDSETTPIYTQTTTALADESFVSPDPDHKSEIQHGSYSFMVLTMTGVVSAVAAALLVASISVTIHIAVYQCVYKPRLRFLTQIVERVASGVHQKDDVTGHDYATIYDDISQRDGTDLKMNQNEVYGLAEPNLQ